MVFEALSTGRQTATAAPDAASKVAVMATHMRPGPRRPPGHQRDMRPRWSIDVLREEPLRSGRGSWAAFPYASACRARRGHRLRDRFRGPEKRLRTGRTPRPPRPRPGPRHRGAVPARPPAPRPRTVRRPGREVTCGARPHGARPPWDRGPRPPMGGSNRSAPAYRSLPPRIAASAGNGRAPA